MKRIRKVGLNRNTKSILNKLKEIDKNIILDLCLCLLDKERVRGYCSEVESFDEAIMFVVKYIFDEEPVANKIIMDLVKLNECYISEFSGYTIEQIEKEYEKDYIPAFHEVISITPEMMMFHYVIKGLEKDTIFNHALEWYYKNQNEYLENKRTFDENIKLKYATNSLFEQELNEFYHGVVKNADNLFDEEHLKDLEERYHGKIIGENISINHRILSFYDYNAKLIIGTKELVDTLSSLVIAEHHKAFGILNKTKSIIELNTQIDVLKNKVDSLERDKKFLEEKLDSKSTPNNSVELEKENYYLKTQVEKLKLENQELLQTIKELKETVDDLPITIDKVEPTNIYEGQSIVVVGGHWTEKEKDNVRASYIADFIESEDIIKYTERIKNYDMIVFDTSRNSHINFNRLKSNSKLRLISMSKKDRIDELFVK